MRALLATALLLISPILAMARAKPFDDGDYILIAMLLAWIASGGIVGTLAQGRGRNATGWWLFGMVAFPLAFILVLLLPKTDRGRLASGQYVRCDACHEVMHINARVCPHCRSSIA
jgi:uncharacterized membrane protein HdeD (DUF308 family)